MTYSKEELNAAFQTVFSERLPELGDMPDHVFSPRFEAKMNKLIAREAAHPWAVSHTAVKNALIAALVAILLFALSMSVSGVRDALHNFIVRHFDTHADVIFDDTGRKEIEHVYEITELPEGFELTEKSQDTENVEWKYEALNGEYIYFIQMIPHADNGISIDNEDNNITTLQVEDQLLLIASLREKGSGMFTLIWERDGYEFRLIMYIPGYTQEEAIQLYKSIK